MDFPPTHSPTYLPAETQPISTHPPTNKPTSIQTHHTGPDSCPPTPASNPRAIQREPKKQPNHPICTPPPSHTLPSRFQKWHTHHHPALFRHRASEPSSQPSTTLHTTPQHHTTTLYHTILPHDDLGSATPHPTDPPNPLPASRRRARPTCVPPTPTRPHLPAPRLHWASRVRACGRTALRRYGVGPVKRGRRGGRVMGLRVVCWRVGGGAGWVGGGIWEGGMLRV